MSSRKRAPTKTDAPKARKKVRTGTSIRAPDVVPSLATAEEEASRPVTTVRDRFIALFEDSQYVNGISNSELKTHFSDAEYRELVPVINELTATSKLTMSRTAKELHYVLVDDQTAARFEGLDPSARMVYQVIEKTQNMGCWTKEIRMQTNIQQIALTKILKSLESRRLIKPVKSVLHKSRKIYMLFELQPAEELTGGVWYSNLEFDHEFISRLRYFLIQTCRKKPQTLQELHHELAQRKVSNVELSMDDVRQLLQTLVFDYQLEEEETLTGEHRFVMARRVTIPCEFSWWEAIHPDFGFRQVVFEDNVTLAPHEPHYQTE